uniref:Uncharacterized protein n=1 Tax=Romanomermis culicivorax TaxID=13658 RepID=A0A915L5K9_ROMCU
MIATSLIFIKKTTVRTYICTKGDGPACQSGMFASPLAQQEGQQCSMTGCPEGFVCRRGPFFSQCCNKTTEAWFTASYENICKNGKRAYTVGDNVLNADSCDDFTCPDDLLCETTNPLFAKCCSQ